MNIDKKDRVKIILMLLLIALMMLTIKYLCNKEDTVLVEVNQVSGEITEERYGKNEGWYIKVKRGYEFEDEQPYKEMTLGDYEEYFYEEEVDISNINEVNFSSGLQSDIEKGLISIDDAKRIYCAIYNYLNYDYYSQYPGWLKKEYETGMISKEEADIIFGQLNGKVVILPDFVKTAWRNTKIYNKYVNLHIYNVNGKRYKFLIEGNLVKITTDL